MSGTPYAQRTAWHQFLRDHTNLGQQFVGTDDESTLNGALGCTHELLECLIFAKTGHLVSHDEISKIAGYPWPANNPTRRGLRWNESEMMAVVRHFGLPYELWFADSWVTTALWDKLKANVREAPVLTAVKYSHYPEDRGYVYDGTRADGYPNGYAIAHGKTQLTGAENIAHAIALVGYWYSERRRRWLFSSKDPNHGSSNRPERPPFDLVSPTQVKTMLNSIRQFRLGGEPRPMSFLIPTKSWKPRGY